MTGSKEDPRELPRTTTRAFPNELLLIIVELCPGVLDKVCFAATCKCILSLSHDHIEEYKKGLATPRVDGRLICVGEHVDFCHLPSKVLTKEERHAFGESLKKDTGSCSGDGWLRHMLDKSTPHFTGLARNKDALAFLERCSPTNCERILDLHDLHYPPRDDWVVCDITTKQYICAKAIAEMAGEPNDVGPFLPRRYPDLGHVILYRISCLPTPSAQRRHRAGKMGREQVRNHDLG